MALSTPAAPVPRPNVVVFLADDLGYGDLGCHGNPHVKTPQLDAFARQAVEFTQFHVSPVCAPTRASLLTGRYNFRTGIADVFGEAANMDPKEVTVAQLLRDAGYATGLFGKWHLGEVRTGPKHHGFDESLTFQGATLRGGYFDTALIHNGKPEKRRGYCMDIFTDAAVAWVRQNRDRPFFVYLPANLIHTPLQVPPELAAAYDSLGLGTNTARAYGMVRSVDNSFGRLRAALKELGLEDNTLLVFISDNGPCSGSKLAEHRYLAGLHGLKGTVYQGGIRVPCFMRWPGGFKSPGRVDRMAAHVDLMPSVLAACGVPAPPGLKLDGLSLLPLLRDASTHWPDRKLFFQWDSGQVPRRGQAFAVLTAKWKLVQPCGMDLPQQQHIRDTYAALCRLQGRGERSIEGPPRFELYDIARDPAESKDVAAAHPELVEKMKQQYDAWFSDVAARWLK